MRYARLRNILPYFLLYVKGFNTKVTILGKKTERSDFMRSVFILFCMS